MQSNDEIEIRYVVLCDNDLCRKMDYLSNLEQAQEKGWAQIEGNIFCVECAIESAGRIDGIRKQKPETTHPTYLAGYVAGINKTCS